VTRPSIPAAPAPAAPDPLAGVRAKIDAAQWQDALDELRAKGAEAEAMERRCLEELSKVRLAERIAQAAAAEGREAWEECADLCKEILASPELPQEKRPAVETLLANAEGAIRADRLVSEAAAFEAKGEWGRALETTLQLPEGPRRSEFETRLRPEIEAAKALARGRSSLERKEWAGLEEAAVRLRGPLGETRTSKAAAAVLEQWDRELADARSRALLAQAVAALQAAEPSRRGDGRTPRKFRSPSRRPRAGSSRREAPRQGACRPGSAPRTGSPRRRPSNGRELHPKSRPAPRRPVRPTPARPPA
jgi:hypothetical protein